MTALLESKYQYLHTYVLQYRYQCIMYRDYVNSRVHLHVFNSHFFVAANLIVFPYLYQVRDKDIQLLRSNGLIRVNSKV